MDPDRSKQVESKGAQGPQYSQHPRYFDTDEIIVREFRGNMGDTVLGIMEEEDEITEEVRNHWVFEIFDEDIHIFNLFEKNGAHKKDMSEDQKRQTWLLIDWLGMKGISHLMSAFQARSDGVKKLERFHLIKAREEAAKIINPFFIKKNVPTEPEKPAGHMAVRIANEVNSAVRFSGTLKQHEKIDYLEEMLSVLATRKKGCGSKVQRGFFNEPISQVQSALSRARRVYMDPRKKREDISHTDTKAIEKVDNLKNQLDSILKLSIKKKPKRQSRPSSPRKSVVRRLKKEEEAIKIGRKMLMDLELPFTFEPHTIDLNAIYDPILEKLGLDRNSRVHSELHSCLKERLKTAYEAIIIATTGIISNEEIGRLVKRSRVRTAAQGAITLNNMTISLKGIVSIVDHIMSRDLTPFRKALK